jgi:hypothetical protein
MKRASHGKSYRLEDLVVAAYRAAREATSDPLLAAKIATRVLEDYFMKSGRMDLLTRLQALAC